MPRLYVYFILPLIGIAVFAQSLGFAFIQLDDPKHIFENPVMLNPSLAGLWSIWSAPYFSLYIPVTYSFWWMASLISHSPVWFRALNVCLHVTNAFLVYRLAEKFFDSKDRTRISLTSLAVALFFLLHPLQVQTVSWISTTKDLLCASLSLLSLLLWQRQSESADYRLGLKAWGFYLLSLLAKPSSALLPLAAYCLFPGPTALRQRNRRWLLLGFLLVIPLMALTKFLQPDAAVQIRVDLADRFFVITDAIGFYVSKLVIPYPLMLDYGRNPAMVVGLGFANPYLGVGLGTLGALLWATYRRWKSVTVLFAALGILLPVLGIIPFQFQVFSTVADHYFYLALVFVGLGLGTLLQTVRPVRQILTISVGALLMAALSSQQLRVWPGDETLFGHNLRWNPNSFLSHNNLGFYLFYTGHADRAVRHFSETVRLRPGMPELKRNLAGALAASGRKSEAQALFSN